MPYWYNLVKTFVKKSEEILLRPECQKGTTAKYAFPVKRATKKQENITVEAGDGFEYESKYHFPIRKYGKRSRL